MVVGHIIGFVWIDWWSTLTLVKSVKFPVAIDRKNELPAIADGEA